MSSAISPGLARVSRGTLGHSANPRTTSVALRDGGHWLVVGGQVARDEAGNVIGKGDMRAQIEQVGKNVDICLKAGGATVNDIIFMVNQVTAPTEFDKYPRPARALLRPTFAR